MQARIILLIIPLLIVVQSAEAANYTTTITSTVTIVSQQEDENFGKHSMSTGGGFGNVKTGTTEENHQENTVETPEENQEENIPSETIRETPSQQGTVAPSITRSSIQFIQTDFGGGLPYIQQGDEMQYLTANRINMPEFEPNPVSVIAEPKVIAPLVAAVGVGIVSAFPIKPVGFSAASAKTFRVAVMYRRSMLFSKTQTVFALAFLSLAFASLSNFMNLEIVSLILFPIFFGMIIYHNALWYVHYSYCRVDTLSKQVLVILPVLGLLGYLFMVFTEAIPFDMLQAIVIVGMLAVVPSTIFTALSFRGSRLETKWMLITAGLSVVMSGIILSYDFMISTLSLGDVLVMAGCGLVVWGQYNLSTKYSTK